MRLHAVTSLTRRLDLSLPSNRLPVFAACVFLVAGTAAGLVAGDLGTTAAALQGARAAGGVVLAWAIGRELDPDRASTARYAVFAYAAMAWLGPPSLVALVALLAALRIALRPTGPPPRVLDLLGVVVIALGAAHLDVVGTPAALAVAAALALDLSLPGEPARGAQGAVASVLVVATLLVAVVSGTFVGGWRLPDPAEAAAVAAALLGLARLRAQQVRARTDVGERPVPALRLARTRQLLVVTVAAGLAWAGGAGVASLAPALAGLAGLGVTGLILRARHPAAPVTALTGRVPVGALAVVVALAVTAPACAVGAPPADAPSPAPAATTDVRPRTPTGTPDSDPPGSAATTHPTPAGPTEPATSDPTDPPELDDPASLAAALARAETRLRDPDLPAPAATRWAHLQQAAYRRLAARPAWRDPVRAAVPERLREAFGRNLRATARLRELTDPREALPDDWRIVEPPAPEVLLDAYREAAEAFGLDWTYLAAIHLTETRMGRIRGTSTAGARGPMQFLPETWEAYGRGDITDPQDAIEAAARYLADHGAPDDMDAALYAYNHSDHYVRAVSDHAAVMRADPVTYHAYHRWQVYYRLGSGDVILPVGWPQTPARPAPAAE